MTVIIFFLVFGLSLGVAYFVMPTPKAELSAEAKAADANRDAALAEAAATDDPEVKKQLLQGPKNENTMKTVSKKTVPTFIGQQPAVQEAVAHGMRKKLGMQLYLVTMYVQWDSVLAKNGESSGLRAAAEKGEVTLRMDPFDNRFLTKDSFVSAFRKELNKRTSDVDDAIEKLSAGLPEKVDAQAVIVFTFGGGLKMQVNGGSPVEIGDQKIALAFLDVYFDKDAVAPDLPKNLDGPDGLPRLAKNYAQRMPATSDSKVAA